MNGNTIHARAFSRLGGTGGRLVGVALCDSICQRTDEDDHVSCPDCVRELRRLGVFVPTLEEANAYEARMCGPIEGVPARVAAGGPNAYARWMAENLECSKCGCWHTRATGAQPEKTAVVGRIGGDAGGHLVDCEVWVAKCARCQEIMAEYNGGLDWAGREQAREAWREMVRVLERKRS